MMNSLALSGNMPEILKIEDFLKTLPQADFPVTEIYIDGVYARTIHIPTGSILTGKIHNHECISILSQGTLKLCNGSDSYEITAPWIKKCEAGTKNLGVAVTDCTFTTIHKYSGSSPVEDLTSNTFEEYEQKLLERDFYENID